MTETETDRLRVWHCETCSGLWLPAGAFHADVGHVSIIGRGRPAGLLCPRDAHQLTAVIHRGVEVDVCGTCGGIWFDRGELEKILGMNAELEPKASGFGSRSNGLNALDSAVFAVELLSAPDAANDVVSAVFDFLGGLFP